MSRHVRISKDYIAAGSHDTSETALHQLSKSNVAAIRRRVAENPRVPLELLKQLATDSDYQVRIAVGLNRLTELSVITTLIYDDNSDVRLWLASASYLPGRLLLELMDDANPYVADRARRTLQRQEPTAVSIFEFLEQDHSLVVGKLEHLLRQQSDERRDHLSDEILDVLDGIRRHFEQQHRYCLELISSSEYQETLFQKCRDDQSHIVKAVDALLHTNTEEANDFTCALTELIERVIEHVRFANTELFESLRKCLTPDELTQMNCAVNSQKHTAV